MRLSRLRLLGVAAVAVLLLVGAGGFAAPFAGAYDSYVHGDIVGDADPCGWCHQDDHTDWPPTNSKCLTCHGDYDVADASLTCWTCHTPGQDMSAARSDGACTAACHLADGTTVTHGAHADRPATCTSCHPVSSSATQAGGSPHHTFVPPAASVTGFSPASGAPGTPVTVNGAGFVRVLSVTFGGVLASRFTADSATQITVWVPAGATTGPIAVTTVGGTASSAVSFVVPVPFVPAPTVSTFFPTSGFPGTTVTVTGAGFAGATSVTLGGVAATFAVISDAEITAAVPTGAASGPVTVTGPDGAGTSVSSFTVLVPITASVTLKVSRTTFALGRSVRATGGLWPPLDGSKVTLVVQRRSAGSWRLVSAVQRETTDFGASYSWRYTPGRHGTYRAKAKVAETAWHTAAQSRWVSFSVK
jgi:hypothetical protein